MLVDGVKAGTKAVRRTEITPPRDGALYVVAQADAARQLVEANPEDNTDRLPVHGHAGGRQPRAHAVAWPAPPWAEASRASWSGARR